MRSRLLLLCLAAVACCLAFAAITFAQGEPNEGDGGGGVYASSASVNPVLSNSFPASTLARKGILLGCGQAADKRDADVSCQIDAKVTIKKAVAHFLGLSSTVIASGVAGHPVDHLKDDNDDDLGRVYSLELKDSVKSALRAKHVRGLGVHITGTVRAHTSAFGSYPATDKVICDGFDMPSSSDSCPIKAGKRSIIPAGDGELVCWRYMPWYLATPAKWGKMCPRPHQI